VQHIHSEISFIVKSFFFTFMGMMLGPPLGAIAFGIFLGFALFAARVPAVRLSMIGSSLSPSALKIVTVSLPRGMAAGVLATLPSAAGIPDMERLPVIVFSAVFTTILIFAIGFPLAQRGEKERPAEAGLS
jgi:cell volume regulation protein A